MENRVVELSVGGRLFHTTLKTLQKEEGSMLCSMFSGRWPLLTTRDGAIFVDRSPDEFHHVLAHLRGGALLPDDRHSLDSLLLEARYLQVDSLVERILAHDMNTHRIQLLYVTGLGRKDLCFEFDMFQVPLLLDTHIQQIRRERDSFLAQTAARLYDTAAAHARVLSIILGTGPFNASLSPFPSIAAERTAFADFDSALTIKTGPFESEFTLLRSGRARETMLGCALATVAQYLRCGELSVNFSMDAFKTQLEHDFTRSTEDAAGGAHLGVSVSWLSVHKGLRLPALVDHILVPLVADVADYFGLSQLASLTRAKIKETEDGPPPLVRMNSV